MELSVLIFAKAREVEGTGLSLFLPGDSVALEVVAGEDIQRC